jgi:hypothetical protein
MNEKGHPATQVASHPGNGNAVKSGVTAAPPAALREAPTGIEPV